MGIISSSRIPVAVATEIKKCNICSNELNLLELNLYVVIVIIVIIYIVIIILVIILMN